MGFARLTSNVNIAGSKEDGSFEFGQREPLAVRIRGLIREYPRDLGLLKEFIQNADDAGADTVRMTLDLREWPRDEIESDHLKAVCGPAIVVQNNMPFSELDFEHIQRLGDSAKLADPLKVGRFGRGFNTVYNVTDLPLILSADWLAACDPHQRVFGRDKTGMAWRLTHADKLPLRRLLAPFADYGYDSGPSFRQALFRLPLRDRTAASTSQLTTETFAPKDFHLIVEQAISEASTLLIFCRNVLHLELLTIDEQGRRASLLQINTLDGDKIRVERNRRLPLLQGTNLEVLQALAQGAAVHPPFQHNFTVASAGREDVESWLISAGYCSDTGLLTLARELAAMGERALPLSGAATRLLRQVTSIPTPVEGRFFCGLPLPEKAQCPVHINGAFDIDSSRQGLFRGQGVIGKAAQRAQWNQLLVARGCARHYANLIVSIADGADAERAFSNYSLLPIHGHDGGYADVLQKATLELLANERWVRAERGGETCIEKPRDVYQAPAGRVGLEETLIALGVPIVCPSFPSDILKSRAATKVIPKTVSPKFIRELIRRKERWELPLSEVEPKAFRSLEAIKIISSWLVADDPSDLDGLPLAFLRNKNLSVFSDESPTLLATAAQTVTLAAAQLPLIDTAFAESVGLSPDESEAYRRVEHEDLATVAKKICSPDNDTTARQWSPRGQKLPNEEWLSSLLEAIVDVGTPPKDLYEEAAIIPDRQNALHCPGFCSSPLLASVQTGHTLLVALDRIGASIIGGSGRTRKALASLSEEPRRLVWSLERADLIEALSDSNEWRSVAVEHVTDAELVVEWIAEGSDDLSEEARKKLSALPIFPTTNGSLSATTGKNVFVATDLKFPKVDSEIVVLATGTWRSSLYEALNIPSLTRVEFVQRVILPVFDRQPPPQQYQLLTWMRDEHSRILAEVGTARSRVMQEISNTPLVRLVDNTLVSIRSIYDLEVDPDDPIAGRAPKISDVYRSEWSLWQPFFSQFGMAREGRAEDLIATVEELSKCDQTEELFSNAATVCSWTISNWDRLARDGGSKLTEVLTSARWIPAQRGVRLLKGYACAKEPELRLFRPNEVVLARLGHLAASQLPIAVAGLEPPTQMRTSLKLPGSITIAVVQRHIQQVISSLEQGKEKTITESVFKCLAEFYRYCGVLRDHDADAMARWAQGQRLIWNPTQQRLVSSDHVFSVDVARYEPRWMRLRSEQGQERGLDLLGRRAEVTAEDLQRLLIEIAVENGDRPISRTDHEIVFHALHYLRHLEMTLPPDIPVITRRQTLAPAEMTIRCDVKEWLPLIADHPKINVLHDDLGSEIAHAASIARASDALTEALEADPIPSNDQGLIGQTERLRSHLCSEEFSIGLRRIVAFEHGTTSNDVVEWLQGLSVVAVRGMAIHLYGASGTLDLGPINSTSYFDRETITLYTAEGEKRRRDLYVARIVNDMLGKLRLNDRAPLEAIIRCSIADIDGELEDRNIERLEGRNWKELDTPIDEETIGEVRSAFDDEELIEQSPAKDDEETEENGSDELPAHAPPGSRAQGTSDDSVPSTSLQEAVNQNERSHPNTTMVSSSQNGRSRRRTASGESRADPPDRSSQRRLISYVSNVGNAAHADDEGQSAEERRAIDSAAVVAVIEQEKTADLTVTKLAQEHQGWDVEVKNAHGVIVKRIEIKGTRGAWGERGVGLTPSQMFAAREYGDTYWLYVVEHALNKPRVYRIQNPAKYVDRYMFDSGWRFISEDASQEPYVGMEFPGAEGLLKIVEVLPGDKTKLIRVEGPDGNRRLMPWTKNITSPSGMSE